MSFRIMRSVDVMNIAHTSPGRNQESGAEGHPHGSHRRSMLIGSNCLHTARSREGMHRVPIEVDTGMSEVEYEPRVIDERM